MNLSLDETRAHIAYRQACCRRTWILGRMRGRLVLWVRGVLRRQETIVEQPRTRPLGFRRSS